MPLVWRFLHDVGLFASMIMLYDHLWLAEQPVGRKHYHASKQTGTHKKSDTSKDMSPNNYLVPYNLSPASPKPGTIYA